MKKLITILCLIVSLQSFCTNYYFSNTGNDGNAGTSFGAPWQTLTKFNTFFSSLAAGDSVLFKRGDVFVGIMTISKSGSVGNPIKIGAYGTGNMPVINGFTTISAWTSLGSGIYESTSAVSALTTMNMVTLNGIPVAMGRYPKITAANKGYLAYQTHSGQTSITSNAISGITSFVGGEVVIRSIQHILDRCVITAQTSTTVSYTSVSSYTPIDNYGFFFQNHPATLTQANTALGEWYFDPATKKLRMYFGGASPGSYTIKGSTQDVLATAISKSYINFDNISFQGANTKLLKLDGSNHIIVRNCEALYAGQDAIAGLSVNNITVDNSLVNWASDNSIYFNTATIDASGIHPKIVSANTITNNTIKNTGTLAGMGRSGDVKQMGIAVYGSNNLVEYNRITNTGYCSIYYVWGDNVLIKNNYVDSFCSVKNDGGGLYTFNNNATPASFTGQRITGNIFLNALSSAEGTTSSSKAAYGIYLDINVAGLEIDNNTVANAQRGLFNHNSHDLNVHHNTFFDNSERQIDMTYSSDATAWLVRNVILSNNIFFAKSSTEVAAMYRSLNADLPSFGTFDNNYYCRPVLETTPISTMLGTATTLRSLSGWQTFSGDDLNSNITATTVPDVSKIRFEYNATNAPVAVSLSAFYSGVDGTAYSLSVTIPAYSSLILLETSPSTACPTSGTTTSGTYYFSTICGDDNRTATQARNPITPWKTITKLNSYFASLQPGDSVLFNRGETFSGTIAIGRSGTNGSPIILGAYGTGAAPVITKLTPVTNWTLLSNDIYESNAISGGLSTLDMVLVNGVEVGKGRYPNSDAANGGYLTVDAFTSTTITDAALPTSPNWTGAEVCVRSNRWQLDRNPITAHNVSTHVLTFTNTTGDNPRVSYGYFISNSPNTLDQQNEWYYNPSTLKIRIKDLTGVRTTMQVATGTNLVTSTSRSDIKFVNIDFNGCNGNNFSLSGGTRITIQNCTIRNSGIIGVRASGTKYLTIQNNTFLNSNSDHIELVNSCQQAKILTNNMRNSAMIPGLWPTNSNTTNAIFFDGTCDTVHVIGNSIIKSGGAGVNFRNSDSLLIKNNYIDSFNIHIDDIGGIYSYNTVLPVTNNWGRVVRGNIILNGIGAPQGTNMYASPTDAYYLSSFGIYWDNRVSDILCDSNYIKNGGRANIYQHSDTRRIITRGNTLYNSQYLFYFVGGRLGEDIINNTITGNILFATGTQKVFYLESPGTTSYLTIGTINNNYMAYRDIDSLAFVTKSTSGTVNRKLSSWRSLGFDINSDTVKTLSGSILKEVYTTSSGTTFSLSPYLYIDARHTNFANFITLNPYKSGVLIRGNTNPSPRPDTLSISTTITSSILCKNGSGIINVSGTGGLEPYSGDFGDHTVTAGTYTYILIDANGSRDTGIISISEPNLLSATKTAGTISVYLGTTTVTVSATGGTSPYQYRINSGVWQASNLFTVYAGTYTVDVKDANGCTYQLPVFSVTQPASSGTDIILHKRKHIYQ